MRNSYIQFLALNLLILCGLALAPHECFDGLLALPAKVRASANMQSQANPYEVKGYVWSYNYFLPQVRVSGVTMTFTRVSGNGNLPQPAKTDENGNWKQSGFELGTTYRVTPSLADYVFDPPSMDFTNSFSLINPFQTIKTTPFDLFGRVADGRGIGVPDVRIVVTFGATETFEVKTDADGNFRKSGVPVHTETNSPYNVTALKSDLQFSPQPYSFRRIDQPLNFVAITGRLAVVSSATFKESVASNSIATIFGSDLAAGTESAGTLPLPNTLAGAQVWMSQHFLDIARSPGTPVPLLFVSPTQINFVVPMMYVPVPSWFTVRRPDGAYASRLVVLDFVAPGLFSANGTGRGVAAALALRVKADGARNYEPVAALDPSTGRYVSRPIDLGPETDRVFLVLFGSGMQMQTVASVTARIGGQAMPVLFAGPQPEFAGLDQVNLSLLRSLAGRGEMDLVVTASGRESNTVTVHIK